MSFSQFGVVGIGNALVDVLTQTDDAFIDSQAAHGMHRGAMALIDEVRAVELYALMGQGIEMSGGSVANAMAHYAFLGGKAGYIGKVADDQLGDVFRHDMKALGIHFSTQLLIAGPGTGRCLILVTPDAQRTMNTFLGAATQIHPEDVDGEIVAAAEITYLEGYLFDAPHCKNAFFKAGTIAGATGKRVALTLSDLFCVERHRKDFLNLIDHHIDILFANESEIKALVETDDLPTALDRVRGRCEIAVVTLGARGSLILSGDETFEIAAQPPTHLVDTTGAGDAYSAGFLYGFTHGLTLRECGALGTKTASSVLTHMGPRPIQER